MDRRRKHLAVVASVLAGLPALGIACGGGPGPDEPVALVVAAGSGEKLAGAGPFRFAVTNRAPAEAGRSCPRAASWEGTMDPGARRISYDLGGAEGPELIVTADTVLARSSALGRVRAGRPWVAVPLADAAHLPGLAATTGISFKAGFWETGDGGNPMAGAPRLREMASAADRRGPEDVRGTATVRYDLQIDPAKIGLFSGGTTTTTARRTPEQERARRQRLLEQLSAGKPWSPAAAEAFLAGDTDRWIAETERGTGTTMRPAERVTADVMVSGDAEGAIRRAEQATGTSMPADERRGVLAFAPMFGGEGSGGVGGVFAAMTTMTAGVWVADDGTLRRLDQRVGFVPEEGKPPWPPLVDASIEFWEVGTAVVPPAPDAGDVVPVADLPPGAVPPPGPCGWR